MADSDLERIRVWAHLMSDEIRLKLWWRLSHGDMYVSELVAYFNLPQSLVSHHLADLRQAQIVESYKQGRFVYYRLTALGQKALYALQAVAQEGE